MLIYHANTTANLDRSRYEMLKTPVDFNDESNRHSL